MNLQDEIDKEVRKFGKKLAVYLRANLELALQKGGSKNVQNPALSFDERITQTEDGVTVRIFASGEYWVNIEKGRAPNSKAPPSKALGKKWQQSNNIDPRKVLAEIKLNYERKRGLSKINRRLSKTKKGLSFDAAAKSLSFILSRSIGKKGIKAKPYVDMALKEADVEGFKKTISEVMGKNIAINLNLSNEFKTIKINL